MNTGGRFAALGMVLTLGAISSLMRLEADDQGVSLIGTQPKEWHLREWQNSPPLKLANLKGKVVLVRWWMAPGCPYCKATAPALAEFHAAYQDKGLMVIAAYHHKAPGPLKVEDVQVQAKKLGFNFPVAIDPEWKTLREWWLDGQDRDFTSVSFLLDKEGIIRFVHPGGDYVKGDKDYTALKRKIEELLKQ